CVASPHVAWSPFETRQNLVNRSAENLRALLDGAPKNVKN
ncbi:MAG: glycerate dehydrogenase, partial [Oscillospiraceae bacterium]